MVINRYLEKGLLSHLSQYRQMVFLSGPRQVGKTTLTREIIAQFVGSRYFDWDDFEDRSLILRDAQRIASVLQLDRLSEQRVICAFDELHKYSHWRDFLKGLYDTFPILRTVVTGRAQLHTFSRGGDSLRGRYFPYTLHPLSVAGLTR